MKHQLLLLLSLIGLISQAQDSPVINGNLETNFNIFLRDSLIGAVSQPQYQNQFYGGEAWLNVSYAVNGFTAGIRYDIYNNSNLRNPNESYTEQGVGRWFVRKDFDKLTLQVGNIYDQIGSGILFRSYEQRPLFIDNAIIGTFAKYKFNDHVSIKGMAGRQKRAFGLWGGNLKGFSLDTYWSFGEEKPLTIAPGVGFMNKTLSDADMDKVVSELTTFPKEEQFTPTYNNYAFSLYNTLSYGPITWYVEGAYKTKDIFNNPFATPQLQFKPGSVLYSSLSYAKGKLGVTLEGKRTENFVYRMAPDARLLVGLVSYIPPMTRVNTYRLTARYSPATQEVSEQAFQLDVRYKWNKKLSTLVNVAHITTLDNVLLYNELFTEAVYKFNRKAQLTAGLQLQDYNQDIYLGRAEKPNIKAVTPYVDFLFKFNRKNALRTEFQYMNTDRDLGSWIFGLAEYSIAPHWIFELSGMYNVDPYNEFDKTNLKKLFYPSVGAVYVQGSNRYQLRYVKQVEGIVCSGGICRLEPAFSGVRLSVNSTF